MELDCPIRCGRFNFLDALCAVGTVVALRLTYLTLPRYLRCVPDLGQMTFNCSEDWFFLWGWLVPCLFLAIYEFASGVK